MRANYSRLFSSVETRMLCNRARWREKEKRFRSTRILAAPEYERVGKYLYICIRIDVFTEIALSRKHMCIFGQQFSTERLTYMKIDQYTTNNIYFRLKCNIDHHISLSLSNTVYRYSTNYCNQYGPSFECRIIGQQCYKLY